MLHHLLKCPFLNKLSFLHCDRFLIKLILNSQTIVSLNLSLNVSVLSQINGHNIIFQVTYRVIALLNLVIVGKKKKRY